MGGDELAPAFFRAIARKELDVLHRQVQLGVAGIFELDAVMRGALHLDRPAREPVARRQRRVVLVGRAADAEHWAFEQSLRSSEASPPGFDSLAARTGVRFNGFYLFYAFAASSAVHSALEFVMGSL